MDCWSVCKHVQTLHNVSARPLTTSQASKAGEVQPVDGWAQRLTKAVKEDSVIILLDACAIASGSMPIGH